MPLGEDVGKLKKYDLPVSIFMHASYNIFKWCKKKMNENTKVAMIMIHGSKAEIRRQVQENQDMQSMKHNG